MIVLAQCSVGRPPVSSALLLRSVSEKASDSGSDSKCPERAVVWGQWTGLRTLTHQMSCGCVAPTLSLAHTLAVPSDTRLHLSRVCPQKPVIYYWTGQKKTFHFDSMSKFVFVKVKFKLILVTGSESWDNFGIRSIWENLTWKCFCIIWTEWSFLSELPSRPIFPQAWWEIDPYLR